jgi:hypothetical protein
MATRAEIAMKVRDKYPDIPDENLKKAVDYFSSNPNAYKDFGKSGRLPTAAMTKLSGEVVSPAKAAVAGAKAGATALKGLAKTIKPTKKKLAGAAVLGAVGAGMNAFDGGDGVSADTQTQANADMMNALAVAQATGVDVNSLMQTPMGQQIFGANTQFDINSFMNAGGIVNTLTGGVYTGKPVTVGKYEGSRFVTTTKDTISLNDWKNQFPMADAKALAAWKKRLVDAGVVSANAGLKELKDQWEAWGEYSQQAVKQGQKLSPYQLLDIQRGLWGGGGDRGPSYSTQLIKTENASDLYKQYLEQRAGRIVDDAEAADFAKFVREKQLATPTKTEVKTVKGKKVTVTTPGYGEAEAAAEAERRAMQDPLYAEFQTNNVFGSAVEKALGLRG